MTSQTLQKVDHSALKANQLIIITLSVLAFILNQPILAAFVALVMGTRLCFESAWLWICVQIPAQAARMDEARCAQR